jgi:hypothetical protein
MIMVLPASEHFGIRSSRDTVWRSNREGKNGSVRRNSEKVKTPSQSNGCMYSLYSGDGEKLRSSPAQIGAIE